MCMHQWQQKKEKFDYCFCFSYILYEHLQKNFVVTVVNKICTCKYHNIIHTYHIIIQA